MSSGNRQEIPKSFIIKEIRPVGKQVVDAHLSAPKEIENHIAGLSRKKIKAIFNAFIKAFIAKIHLQPQFSTWQSAVEVSEYNIIPKEKRQWLEKFLRENKVRLIEEFLEKYGKRLKDKTRQRIEAVLKSGDLDSPEANAVVKGIMRFNKKQWEKREGTRRLIMWLNSIPPPTQPFYISLPLQQDPQQR